MKISCPKCKRKFEVVERQVGRDLECSCGIAFTLTRKMYATAAKRQLVVIFSSIGGAIALAIVPCVIVAMHSGPQKWQPPVSATVQTTSATVASPAKPPPSTPTVNQPLATSMTKPVGTTPMDKPAAPTASAKPFKPAVPSAKPSKPAMTESLTTTKPFAWWKLNEQRGTVATDSAGPHNGKAMRSPLWKPGEGVHGGGLAFNGTGQYISIPPLGLKTDCATITLWVKPGAQQTSEIGLIFHRTRDTQRVAGISLRKNNEIGYTWGGSFYKLSTKLIPPANQWSFIALCVEPQQATLWLKTDSGLQSFTSKGSHHAEDFSSEIRIGSDSIRPDRYFNGCLEDVRIYDRTLTPAEIKQFCP